MLHEVFEQKLSNLRGEIFKAINEPLIKEDIDVIEFKNPVVINSISEDYCEIISSYSRNSEKVFTSYAYNDSTNKDNANSYNLTEMDTDTLLWILWQIEIENYN